MQQKANELELTRAQLQRSLDDAQRKSAAANQSLAKAHAAGVAAHASSHAQILGQAVRSRHAPPLPAPPNGIHANNKESMQELQSALEASQAMCIRLDDEVRALQTEVGR